MFLKHIDLTTALRPSYLPDEVLLFVQDNVGLYEGKVKLPNQQNGQVYLTTHRICYVDQAEPRNNSVALDLKDVERYDFYARFFRSSPKVTLVPKPSKRSSLHNRVVTGASSQARPGSASPHRSTGAYQPPAEPPAVSTATWVCTICSFSNPVPSNFDPAAANVHTPLPPCLACGIKPTLTHVLKAAISNANHRPISIPNSANDQSLPFRSGLPDSANGHDPEGNDETSLLDSASNTSSDRTRPRAIYCPRCTFSNHPSLFSCEICGAPLQPGSNPLDEPDALRDSSGASSPAPAHDQSAMKQNGADGTESIKISFRGGGEKIFYERLKSSMTQRKWLQHNAPPPPKANRDANDSSGTGNGAGTPTKASRAAGIAGLEQLGVNMRKNNEMLIGSAFEDLEALMASAKDVVALAERFARQNSGAGGGVSAEENALLAESASQLGLVTTKDIVGGGGSDSLYLSELARNLAEFLTDDSRGVLKRAGGIITLVDLWAMFNRARGGVELVSPADFEKAARLWEQLRLPVRLRTFRSGVMVVQRSDRTDETTIKTLLSWLQDLHEFPPERELAWDWREFGRGVTAQEAAERFGWSIGVAEEELLMAEERGAVCREEGLEGLKFWKNYIHVLDPTTAGTPAHQKAPREEATLKASQGPGWLF